MSYECTVRTVRDTLGSVFEQVDAWFDQPAEMRTFRPTSGGWSIDQVLEHVALTNRFLMLTLSKGVELARRRALRGDPLPEGESDLDRLSVIGERGSFGWMRPDHMEPTGAARPDEVRVTLRSQLRECLCLLEGISHGVGALHRVTMSVNGLGKIDLYQWLYFLAQHARRHLQQMFAIEAEFTSRDRRPLGSESCSPCP